MVGGNDSNGINSAMLEQFLTWTQETRAMGLILYGIPGAGKSALVKATAGEAEVPCIGMSFSQMRDSLVGNTEQRQRAALRTVSAVGQGEVLMMATANDLDNLPAELRSRFRLGTFFFDFPDEEELAALWKLYMAKYNLTGEIPASQQWVGREVEACCELAWHLKCSLVRAASYITPMAISSAERMKRIQDRAVGRFTSASYEGTYRGPLQNELVEKARKRLINLDMN